MTQGHSYVNPHNGKRYRLGEVVGSTARLYDETSDVIHVQVTGSHIAWETLSRVDRSKARDSVLV